MSSMSRTNAAVPACFFVGRNVSFGQDGNMLGPGKGETDGSR